MQYFHFEHLVRHVADEVNAIIPIISLKDVSKVEWKQQLPAIIKDATGRPPELALCTHLDQVIIEFYLCCIRCTCAYVLMCTNVSR
jgi:hypothetical protein